MVGRSSALLLLILGGAFLAGATALAWYSTVATLELVRIGPASVTATIESRVLGVARVSSTSADGLRSARLQRAGAQDSRPTASDRLLFDGASGPVDLGRDQHRFARDFDAIDAFFRDPSRRDLRLSTIGRGNASYLVLAAQLLVAGLGALGALLLGMGVRALQPEERARG